MNSPRRTRRATAPGPRSSSNGSTTSAIGPALFTCVTSAEPFATWGQLHGELQHLLDDAQATDAAMRQARVYTEVYEEWTGVIRVLNRMLQMAG